MSYRSLRPQYGNATESSNSASRPNQSTPDSLDTNPRLASSLDRGTDDLGSSSSTKPQKRRKVPQPGTVTRNACSNCKKARTKCDGQSPCSRCSTRGETNCVYEIHVKHAKEEMVKTIKDLTAQENMTGKILNAIASGSEHTPSIIRWLQDGESVPTIVEYLSVLADDLPDFRVEDSLSPRNSTYSGVDSPDHGMRLTSEGVQWTTVTTDERVFRHLFSLYFSWIHPVHTLFNEGTFVDSYKNHSNTHCSHALVNAICAMACQLHTRQGGLKDHVDYNNLGSLFMDTARSLIRPEIESLTTVQALTIMFLVDYSRGQGHRASAYLRIATGILSRMRFPLKDGCVIACWQDTVCGTQNLNVEWAQMTFQAPISSLLVPFELLSLDIAQRDGQHWYYYRFEADEPPAWPCALATTTIERARLTAIIRDVTELYHGNQRGDISAIQILEQHRRYTIWRKELSASLGDIENQSQAMPHVLSMLILFHTAVTQLLRPMLSMDGFPRETMMVLEDQAWRHAQSGLYLLERHYRTHWTCRYQPVQQLFSTLHLCDIVARYFPERTDPSSKCGKEAVQLGLEVFYESHEGYAMASHFQDAIFQAASKYSFDLPEDLKKFMSSPRIVYDIDDTIEACSNASFFQPLNEGLARYQPSFAHDWVVEAPEYNFKAQAGTSRRRRPADSAEMAAENLINLMNIRNVLNDG